ncbi:MAG: PstS family phosphate ABC transporter substrate-binding protein [Leptolyngbyaceae cyanobacterium MO_188.B28]|nr:PstS family phosphate ABC transporter substrate-binding protein [Leptolyngbyaceae cyanobacterium MO_188.B28]
MAFKIRSIRFAYSVSMAALLASLTACASGTPKDAASSDSGLSGNILVDGSSTVFPISEAMGEEFNIANPDVELAIGVSGSGGGFKKFCAGETDVSNASRQIKDSEIDVCTAAGIDFIEVPIAYDGITIVVNPTNDWAQCLTVDQLTTIWSPDSEGKINNWNQVDKSYPDQPLDLFGPGVDSGTFDYFTDEVNGEEGASRGDYTASEDDNIVVTGVASDPAALGYFGFAYFEENQDALKAVEIENKDGDCIAPSTEAIADGTYNPMSRPLFFYVKVDSYENKPEVKAFVDYQLDPANGELISDAGYIPFPDDILAKSKARIEQRKLGKDPD